MAMWIRLNPLLFVLALSDAARLEQKYAPMPETLAASDIGPSGCPSTTLRVCSGHGSCISGRCSCDRGFAGGACEQREYLLACPRNCSVSTGGGRCINGRCVCSAGRSGDDCADRTAVNCSLACAAHGHGECVDGGCRCFAGYHGVDCLQGCPGYDVSRNLPCSGCGLCVATGSPGHALDKCKCHIGFEGDGCEQDRDGVTTCARNCSYPRGTCLHGRCTCADRFAGHDCSIELRHGQLSHALDSIYARVGAVVAAFAVSSVRFSMNILEPRTLSLSISDFIFLCVFILCAARRCLRSSRSASSIKASSAARIPAMMERWPCFSASLKFGSRDGV